VGFYFLLGQFLDHRLGIVVGLDNANEAKMKHVLLTIAVVLLLTTASSAAEEATLPEKADKVTEDCSKPVWPHLSPSCLRNANQTINVRLITANRAKSE